MTDEMKTTKRTNASRGTGTDIYDMLLAFNDAGYAGRSTCEEWNAFLKKNGLTYRCTEDAANEITLNGKSISNAEFVRLIRRRAFVA